MKFKNTFSYCALSLLLWCPSSFSSEIEQSTAILERINDKAAETQQQIDRTAAKTEKAVTAYRNVISKTASINQYNAQLQRLIESQTQEMASLSQQIDSLQDTHREILPLMLNMLAGLETFVGLDMPFLLEERRSRIQQLKAMMDKADMSVSDKYRNILDAFMTEIDYGQSIEASEQTLDINQNARNVDILRIGRIALIYQTRDGEQAGYWNRANKTWQPLASSYHASIKKGFKIARKQSAPDLLTIPLPPPTTATQAVKEAS